MSRSCKRATWCWGITSTFRDIRSSSARSIKRNCFTYPPATKVKYLEEMSLVAEAVAKAFHAEKMNYELLGNGDTHLHWHLFPRRSHDLEGYGNNGKGPVWWYPMEKMYDDAQRPSQAALETMKARLLAELEKIF